MKNLFHILLVIAALIVNSCAPELFSPDSVTINDGMTVKVLFESSEISRYRVGTRSAIAKNPEETKINSLYIFFFNTSGELLTLNKSNIITPYPGSTETYFKLDNGRTMLMLNEAYFTDGTALTENVTIYAFANLNSDFLKDISSFSESNQFDSYSYYVYDKKNVNLTQLPSGGMPMFGCADLNFAENTNNTPTLTLKALMARVDISIGINVAGMSDEYPRLDVETVEIQNWAKCIAFSKNITPETTDTELISDDDWIDASRPCIDPRTSYNKTFYFVENIQGAVSDTDYDSFFEGSNFKDLTDEQLQKLKSNIERYRVDFAQNREATCFKISGLYTDLFGIQSKVILEFYLGADNIRDFNVKRNCHYDNKIYITGLSSDKSHLQNHVLYDSRVDVQGTEATPYFISVMNGHEVDAHFAVVPIDFYVYDGVPVYENNEQVGRITNQTLNITIGASANSWIRLERIPKSAMSTGTFEGTGWQEDDDEHINISRTKNKPWEWQAGHGKRKYFTASLMTKLPSTCNVQNRDRVYLYINENISLNDRFAEISITPTYDIEYIDMNRNTQSGIVGDSQTIQIKQLGLLKVAVTSNNGNHTAYMEQIEEYLDNYDPYDTYSSNLLYPGLKWGLMGISLGKADDEEAHSVYLKGAYATNNIIAAGQHQILDLNSPPRSAAEYCYNKNIRDEDGRVKSGNGVSKTGWFLPGISQLEDGITQYYNLFTSFQTEFYWSSSAGKYRKNLFQQYVLSNDHARATRYYDNGTSNPFVESGKNQNDGYDYHDEQETGNNIHPGQNECDGGSSCIGGRATRDKELRIRAFYWIDGGADKL